MFSALICAFTYSHSLRIAVDCLYTVVFCLSRTIVTYHILLAVCLPLVHPRFVLYRVGPSAGTVVRVHVAASAAHGGPCLFIRRAVYAVLAGETPTN